jgi:hypothetical protein
MRYLVSLVGLVLMSCAGDIENKDRDSRSTASTDMVECDNNVCILSGDIVEDYYMTSENIYLLRGGVFIGDDVNPTVLTIEPGTTIYGESNSDGMLVIRRNAKIIAQGTVDKPIVFTSSKEEGFRNRGDWGGVIINGNAPVNSCGVDFDGDVCEAFGEGGAGFYGGNNPDDDSGILEYVRVEFAGTLLSPDNELNGIAFQGVGSGTRLNYIHVHMNADDGVEFFGGTANIKHLVVTGVGDDALDWTDGWQGSGQYVILQQHLDAGDNGIEADNNGENNMATPMSNPTLSNMTIIGSGGASSDLGILLREGTGAFIANTLVYGWGDASLDVDGDATWANADDGDLAMVGTLVDSDTNFKLDDGEPQLVEDWFYADNSNEEGGFALTDAQNQTEPNFLPVDIIDGAVTMEDPFFEEVSFIGAMGDIDWTLDWTAYPDA